MTADKKRVLSLDISAGRYADFVSHILLLAKKKRSSYVCTVNVHMMMEAHKDNSFARIVNEADVASPDGVPVALALRLLHGIRQDRVAGMDLLPDIIRACEQQGLSVFFYGSTTGVLNGIKKKIAAQHPALRIAGLYSPPFRLLSCAEEEDVVRLIDASGANIVFVGLGCPRQEKWMSGMKGKINAVMIGVGGAFLVYAGLQKRAPLWMQRLAMEWMFRLLTEPSRLFKRYLFTNTLFLLLLTKNFLPFRRRLN